MDPRDKERRGLGYAGAIAISALGHAAFLYLVLFALPRWFTSESAPPPAYSVNIVDNIPAGDLGTHLPKLSGYHRHQPESNPEFPPEEQTAERSEEKPPSSNAPKIDAPNSDPNAIALNNSTVTPAATPAPTERATPTPTPEATASAAATKAPAVAATPEPTARPTRKPRPTARPTHRPRPTAKPTPRPRHPRASEIREKQQHKGPSAKPTPKVMLAHAGAKSAPPESIKERLARLHENLMREHLKALAETRRNPPASDDEGEDESAPASAGANRGGSGGGPVLGKVNSGGKGYGIGSGSGSLGILKDPDFLLYYQKVQERIKDAWSFYGGNKELTTTVEFAIGPDGKVAGISVSHSSNNTSFDQSVVRAIRRAAPFPPPPEKYRDQFAQGIEAVFKLGELSS